jgi:PTH1 family peptidyl-tRNA hydrolase
MAEPWLVAGLGNPGDRFASTRHNAGRQVIEILCARTGARLRKVRFLSLSAADATVDGTPVLLVVAETFMNLSGPPIASFARKRGVAVDRVVACHDEIDLPFGALRIKRGGSTAGHHGLDSMVSAFRSADFYRVRIGVGRPSGRQDPADFVLEPFRSSEREEAAILIQEAADAVTSLVAEGLASTQDRFNRSGVRDRGPGL